MGQAEVAEVIANEDDQVVGEVGDDDAGDPVSPTNDVQATKRGPLETRSCEDPSCTDLSCGELQARSWSGFGSKDDKTRDLWFDRQKELPSEWQNPTGINTIDLRDLGSSISTYITEVVKLLEGVSKENEIRAGWKVKDSKKTSCDQRAETSRKEWIEKTEPLYDHASVIGSRKAIDLTGERLSQEARESL